MHAQFYINNIQMFFSFLEANVIIDLRAACTFSLRLSLKKST